MLQGLLLSRVGGEFGVCLFLSESRVIGFVGSGGLENQRPVASAKVNLELVWVMMGGKFVIGGNVEARENWPSRLELLMSISLPEVINSRWCVNIDLQRDWRSEFPFA